MLFEEYKIMKINKKTILTIGVISIIVTLIAMLAYPAYAAGADYRYALNQENWVVEEEPSPNLDPTYYNVRTVTINVKGHAFLRIDEQTIKQYDVATALVIHVQPATESTERNVDVTGSVKVNDVIYTFESGKAVLRKEKNLLFIKCQGLDESRNEIALKLGARYFWHGEKTYALRSIAILQTADKPMLLLQRGSAVIQ
jgi:hypothetical protein